jgi:hypothetical protein
MTRFLKNIILFSGLVLIVTLISFYLTIEINRKLYKKIIFNNDINTLVIGDSHTELAINDSLLTNTLNISTPAEGYIFTYRKLQNILKNNNRIKSIMLGVSYHNFSSYYNKYIYEEEPYSLISQHISLLEFDDFPIFFKGLKIKNMVTIYRNSLKNIIKYKSGKYPYIGGFHVEKIHDIELSTERILKRINSQYFLDNKLLGISYVNISYLDKIVLLCREKQIKIVLLNTPLYKDYYSRIPIEFINAYNKTVKNYGVTEINFTGLELPSDCFLPDGDHLSYKGAMVTTEYLVDILKNISYYYNFKN